MSGNAHRRLPDGQERLFRHLYARREELTEELLAITNNAAVPLEVRRAVAGAYTLILGLLDEIGGEAKADEVL